jgi:starvation-inducible outer membrane lipoprotein
MALRIGLFLAATLLLAACTSQPPVLREVRFTQPATSSGR